MRKLIILTRSSLRPILWPLQYLIKPPFILIRKDGRYLKIRRGRLQNEGAEGPDVPIAAHFAFKFLNNSNLKYLIYRIIQIEIVVPFMLMLHSNYKINKKSVCSITLCALNHYVSHWIVPILQVLTHPTVLALTLWEGLRTRCITKEKKCKFQPTSGKNTPLKWDPTHQD